MPYSLYHYGLPILRSTPCVSKMHHHAAVTPTGGELALFPAAYRLPAHVVSAPPTANNPVASPPVAMAAAVVAPAAVGGSVPPTAPGMAVAAAASEATTTASVTAAAAEVASEVTTVPATIARRLSMSNCTISTLCNTVAAYAAALPQLCPGSLVVSTSHQGARRSHVSFFVPRMHVCAPSSVNNPDRVIDHDATTPHPHISPMLFLLYRIQQHLLLLTAVARFPLWTERWNGSSSGTARSSCQILR